MADDKVYEHRPVHANGRDQWLVSQVDPESGSRTPIGLRPASSAEATAAAHAGTVSSLLVRNRAVAEVGEPVYHQLPISEPEEHRAQAPEVRHLDPPGSLFHDRSHCGPCAAERHGRDATVTLPPAQPPESVR
jgi:hypothetical protein